MLKLQPESNRLCEILTALGNATRLRMVVYLLRGETDVTDIVREIGISQSALSQHLQILLRLSIVVSRKERQFRIYSIRNGMEDVLSRLIKVAYSQAERSLNPSEEIAAESEILPKKSVKRRLRVKRSGHPLWRR